MSWRRATTATASRSPVRGATSSPLQPAPVTQSAFARTGSSTQRVATSTASAISRSDRSRSRHTLKRNSTTFRRRCASGGRQADVSDSVVSETEQGQRRQDHVRSAARVEPPDEVDFVGHPDLVPEPVVSPSEPRIPGLSPRRRCREVDIAPNLQVENVIDLRVQQPDQVDDDDVPLWNRLGTPNDREPQSNGRKVDARLSLNGRSTSSANLVRSTPAQSVDRR